MTHVIGQKRSLLHCLITSYGTFGKRFSSFIWGMGDVLELAELHGGNWHAFEAAVRTTYFKDDEPALYRHLAGAPASPGLLRGYATGQRFHLA